jgi:hypothetical protein
LTTLGSGGVFHIIRTDEQSVRTTPESEEDKDSEGQDGWNGLAMNRISAFLATIALIGGGGYAAGHESASSCPKGYTRGVAQAYIGSGPGQTVQQRQKLWQYVMESGCYRRVTLPVVHLVGGPFDGDYYFAEYAGDAANYVVAKTENNDMFGYTQATTADGGVSLEKNKTQIAVRPKTYITPAKPIFGPANHYRLADGLFLGTDPATP